MTDTSPRARLATAALVAGAVGPLAYAGERLYQHARAGYFDPRLILLTTHTDYFWRVLVALWIALSAAIVASTWMARNRSDAISEAPRIARLGLATALLAAIAAFALP